VEATIRPASLRDCEALTGLMSDQLREHEMPVDDARLRESVRGVLDHPERGFFLLAERPDGGTIGAAYVPFLWSLEHAGPVAWLEELYVAPRDRGMGTGAALVRSACVEAAARGCRAMDLEVDSSHEGAARLYQREGFRRLARSRWVRLLSAGRER
jgi:ribosomal protein S18 acetylase RimI-like enzyme